MTNDRQHPSRLRTSDSRNPRKTPWRRFKLVVFAVSLAFLGHPASAWCQEVGGTIDVDLAAASGLNILSVDVSEDYASSYIGSLDEEVGPGIDQALGLKGISTPPGTMVWAKFADGTRALFVKPSNLTTDRWHSLDIATDKNGNPIDRNGNPIGAPSNPAPSGSGTTTPSGTVTVEPIPTTDPPVPSGTITVEPIPTTDPPVPSGTIIVEPIPTDPPVPSGTATVEPPVDVPPGTINVDPVDPELVPGCSVAGPRTGGRNASSAVLYSLGIAAVFRHRRRLRLLWRAGVLNG